MADEPGLNLFEDNATAAGSFPRAGMGGYQRQAVDDYLRHLEHQLSDTRQRNREFETQLARTQSELARRPAAREDLDFADLGGHAGQIMGLARDQAREITDAAQAEAAQIREQAEQESVRLRASADRDAGDVRQGSLEEARTLRSRLSEDSTTELGRARAEGSALVAAAEREAETVRLRARAEADTVAERARLSAEEMLAAAHREVNELRVMSAREREQSVAAMAKDRDEHAQRTAALFDEATRHAQESQERLAADIEGATGIRAQASAEAEQLKATTLRETEERLAIAHRQAHLMQKRAEETFQRHKERMAQELQVLDQRRRQVLGQLSQLAEQARGAVDGVGSVAGVDEVLRHVRALADQPIPPVDVAAAPVDNEPTIVMPRISEDMPPPPREDQ